MFYVDETQPVKVSMKTGIDAMLGIRPYHVGIMPKMILKTTGLWLTGEYRRYWRIGAGYGWQSNYFDPFEGFAAFLAGIRAGDQIIGVNGIDIRGKTRERCW